MGQKKLVRFEAIKAFGNVLEYPENMAGNWAGFFGNHNSLTLELACGKGEYALGLGRMYPSRNFIGVDVKGNRIWRGAKTALDEGLENVAFLRTQIDRIAVYFQPNEVSEIWITFPDPQLRFSKINKRLTHPKFLRFYRQILKPEGTINLKTDSPDLFRFTKAVIEFYGLTLLESSDNVYATQNIKPDLLIKTHYERLDIAGTRKVYYLRFKADEDLPLDRDADFKGHIREGERNASEAGPIDE
ncbi:MAG TPA: tRNA (guanosine(46)-N7)-methyltransferase TrmB [Edaphocola sp.]|nr:tRNA (guanosine(46)-N7)-methyltransferase TrmB [Edaphocola sp.]